jgi:hypothetical protein
MIKSNEVRIGNYVNYFLGIGDNGSEYKVYQIYTIAKEFPTLNTIEFGIGAISWSNIEPIPLTEDWLIRFGFEKQGSKKGTIWKNNSFYILHIAKNKNGEYYISIGSIPISSNPTVHQLQNLCFALTGEELTIKPH